MKDVQRGHCHITMPSLNFRWELDPPRRPVAAARVDTDELLARSIVP